MTVRDIANKILIHVKTNQVQNGKVIKGNLSQKDSHHLDTVSVREMLKQASKRFKLINSIDYKRFYETHQLKQKQNTKNF